MDTVHPRACGEHKRPPLADRTHRFIPARAGNTEHHSYSGPSARFIPARAGNTLDHKPNGTNDLRLRETPTKGNR